MAAILEKLLTLTDAKAAYDDDSIDRMNYIGTVWGLMMLAFLIFAKDYVGEPIQCWVPNQWTGVWETWSERYCFVENTYFVSMNSTHLPPNEKRESMEMIYYQWVPFILAVMALCFSLPRIFWELFSKNTGLELILPAHNAAKKPGNTSVIPEIVKIVERRCPESETSKQARLFNLYMITKTLVVINVFIQFFLLNYFLGTNYVLWGFGLLGDLLMGRHWHESGLFPRVAFCDVTVRELGNVNNWTVQCVLMVNMFNEKIFLLIWWWMVFLLLTTIINYVIWIYSRFSRTSRRNFLHKLKRQAGVEDGDDEHFYKSYLKDDGVFVLRLLDANAGRLIASELYKALRERSRPAPEIMVTSENNSSAHEIEPLLKKKEID